MLLRFILLAMIVVISACPAAVQGKDLCAAADVERLCGTPEDECQSLLETDERFDAEHIYTGWIVSLDDEGHCILRVQDTDTAQDVTFDLLAAQPSGALLDE